MVYPCMPYFLWVLVFRTIPQLYGLGRIIHLPNSTTCHHVRITLVAKTIRNHYCNTQTNKMTITSGESSLVQRQRAQMWECVKPQTQACIHWRLPQTFCHYWWTLYETYGQILFFVGIYTRRHTRVAHITTPTHPSSWKTLSTIQLAFD